MSHPRFAQFTAGAVNTNTRHVGSSRSGVVFWPRAVLPRRRPGGGVGPVVVVPGIIAGPARPVSVRGHGGGAEPSHPVVLRESCRRRLAGLLDRVRAADVPQVVAERCLLLAGAFDALHEAHQVDELGRCSVCWSASARWWWPWPSRSECSIDATLSLYLRNVAETLSASV